MSLRGDIGHKMSLKVSGIPAGFGVDMPALFAFVRRAYRENAPWNLQQEPEYPVTVESGMEEGIIKDDVVFSVMSPALHRNLKLTGIPVPGTADYVDFLQAGRRFPGEDTDAVRKLFCAAGALMLQLLESRGIRIAAHLSSVGLVRDRLFDGMHIEPEDVAALRELAFPVLDETRGMQMIQRILREKAAGNTTGGQIECAVLGLPAGMGGSWFSALQGRLASGAMAVPGVNGVEFGTGFAGSSLRGSQLVDPILPGENQPVLAGNTAGGLLAGRTTGLPLIFRVSVQPMPAITGEVGSADWETNMPVVLTGRVEEDADRTRGRHERPFDSAPAVSASSGRHGRADEESWEDRDEYVDLRTGKTVRVIETGEPDDPCAALTALPCVQAMAALILWDETAKEESIRHGTK